MKSPQVAQPRSLVDRASCGIIFIRVATLALESHPLTNTPSLGAVEPRNREDRTNEQMKELLYEGEKLRQSRRKFFRFQPFSYKKFLCLQLGRIFSLTTLTALPPCVQKAAIFTRRFLVTFRIVRDLCFYIPWKTAQTTQTIILVSWPV